VSSILKRITFPRGIGASRLPSNIFKVNLEIHTYG